MPNFSILMPSFNGEQYLLQALESVISNLSFGDEIILQDGGSTDRTVAIAKSFHSEFVHVVSEKDNGQSDALQKALVRSKNDWIGWINADDLYFPSALAELRSASETYSDADVIYGDYATVDSDGKLIREFHPGLIKLEDLLFGPKRPFNGSMIIKREILLSLGGFKDDFHFCMDYELFLRIWSADLNIRYVPALIGALRLHETSKTGTNPWKFVLEARRARDPFLANWSERIQSVLQTLAHAATVATTSFRTSRLYLRMRHGYRKV